MTKGYRVEVDQSPDPDGGILGVLPFGLNQILAEALTIKGGSIHRAASTRPTTLAEAEQIRDRLTGTAPQGARYSTRIVEEAWGDPTFYLSLL